MGDMGAFAIWYGVALLLSLLAVAITAPRSAMNWKRTVRRKVNGWKRKRAVKTSLLWMVAGLAALLSCLGESVERPGGPRNDGLLFPTPGV